MLKAVIFDMDGVIIDSEPIYYKVCNDILRNFNASMTKDEYYCYVGKPAHEIWNSLKSKYKIQHKVEELIMLNREAYREYLIKNCKAMSIEGVRELVVELYDNNIKLAVASSSSAEIIEIVLNELDLMQYFSIVVSGDDIKEGKTTPHIFYYTAEKLKVESDECLVIEDSSEGIRSARLAGMKCVGIKNPSSGKQALDSSDLIIERFNELNHDNILKLC